MRCAFQVLLALLAIGRADAARLVLVGDVDGDLTSEVLLVTDDGVALLSGARLDEVSWRLALDTRSLVFAMAGDVDGDGLADLAIGDSALGQVTVYLSADGIRTVNVAGQVGDGFGSGVAGVDLDGDGSSELVVGSPGAGRVEVFRLEDGRFNALTAIDGAPGLGREVLRAFDVDGDDFGDVIVRADSAIWVFGFDVESGLRMIAMFDVEQTVAGLGDVDGDETANVTWPHSGDDVVGVGDVNGDFVADVLVNDAGGGRRLVLGAAHGQAPKEIWSGLDAWPIGDVDGDGYADIGWIAELRVDGGARIGIRYGAPELLGGPAVVARPPPDPTPPALPAMPFDPSAVPVITLAGGPDLDLDGLEGDLAIGLPFMDDGDLYVATSDLDTGMVVLLSGGTDAPGVANVLALPARRANVGADFQYGAALSAGSMNRGAGVVVGAPEVHGAGAVLGRQWQGINFHEGIVGGDVGGGRLGASVSLPGDLDGDGLADLGVAEPGYSPAIGLEGAGRVRAYAGTRPGNTALRVILTTEGTGAGAALGLLAAAGDVDGDGLADLVVGSPYTDSVALIRLSETSAKPTTNTFTDPSAPGYSMHFGAALTSADFNGDGRTDIAITAPGDGRVEVYFAGAEPLSATRRQTVRVATTPLGLTLAACDIDADGKAELVVGQPGYSGALERQGRVDVFRINAPTTGPAQSFFGGRLDARLGTALAVLDRNHDGFCDVAMAALDGGEPPLIIVHLGNDGARGRGLRVGVRHPTSSEVIAPWVRTGTRDVVAVHVESGDPMPGSRRLEAEVYAASDGPHVIRRGSSNATSRLDTSVVVRDLAPSTPQSARVQVRWSAANAPFQPSSRWVRPNAYAPARVDFRTRANLPPVALDDSIRVDAGDVRVPLSWLFDNDYDIDGDALELDTYAPLDGGELVLDGDALVYLAPSTTPAERRFQYRVRDSFRAVSRIATVTLAVVDCDIGTCRDGLIGADVELPNGVVAGFVCRVRYDVDPPRIECPRGDDGALRLESRLCE